MQDPFFDFFDSERFLVNPADWSTWENIEFKTYPRAPIVELPPPKDLDKIDLQTTIKKRRTGRELSSGVISRSSISTLLYWSAGLIHKNDKHTPLRRPHPSGGALFPIEIYLGIFRGKDISRGLYHYIILSHQLELISQNDVELLSEEMPYDFAQHASAAIWLTFNKNRVWKKYGSLGFKLGLLEAGHIGQNLCLIAASQNIPIAPIGDGPTAKLREIARLRADESACYFFALGGE